MLDLGPCSLRDHLAAGFPAVCPHNPLTSHTLYSNFKPVEAGAGPLVKDSKTKAVVVAVKVRIAAISVAMAAAVL